MNIIEAMRLIQKEARQTNQGVLDLMLDVLKQGQLAYSNQLVQAVKVIKND